MRLIGLLITLVIIGLLLSWYLNQNFSANSNNKQVIYQQSQDQINEINNKIKQYEKSIN